MNIGKEEVKKDKTCLARLSFPQKCDADECQYECKQRVFDPAASPFGKCDADECQYECKQRVFDPAASPFG
ncbi:hypothetical protein U1Q18_032054, partial [Sarracenia purpurea var. burkii]